jgi:tRNA dimethylallyltransferase
MMKNGLVEEVKNLRKKGLSKDNQSMRAIGYKEVLAYLDGEYDKEKMVELIKQHSRNYAKRQLTFLRGMEGVHFVDVSDKLQAQREIENLIEEWKKL